MAAHCSSPAATASWSSRPPSKARTLTFRALRAGGVLHVLRHPVYALGDGHRHADLLRFPHHVAGHRLELGLAPGTDILRHRAGMLGERRLARSNFLDEVHRVER